MLTNAPKTIQKYLLIVVIATLFLVPIGIAHSQTITDLEKEITEKNQQINQKKGVLSDIEKKIAAIRGSNNSLSQKIELMTTEINNLQNSITETDAQIEEKLKAIEDKQKELSEKKKFLDDISGELYIESRNRVPAFFLLGEGWNNILRGFYIKSSTITFLKEEIEKINGDFSSLADAKASLDKEKESLDTQKKDLDQSYALLNEERAKLQAELRKQSSEKGVLSAEITDLSKKVSQLQSALIAARTAGIVSSGGTTGTVAGTSISQAPAGSFGVFSIGAYTHRNGMSQWGAKARAAAGHSSAQILGFYYPGTRISNGTVVINGVNESLMSTIPVDGYGNLSFEDYYLLGIKEMPDYFGLEALKAQAIAARTYAVRRTNNGRSGICTSQYCQVFNLPLKSGLWQTAVQQTRGQILVNGDGTPAMTQYAAVHGAWVNNVGWDTQSGNGGNWFNDSWERISGVNWFYRSWNTKTYNSNSQTCGHSPFLSQEEMLLLVNGYLIKNDIGLARTPNKARLLPHDFGRCVERLDYGRTDLTPYSLSEMQSLLSNPVRSISNVNVAFGNGTTNSVVFYTNRGIVSIPGAGFKDIYNQMAPGHMHIPQSSFVFINIEKR